MEIERLLSSRDFSQKKPSNSILSSAEIVKMINILLSTMLLNLQLNREMCLGSMTNGS